LLFRFPQPIKLIATKAASNFKNQASFHSATKHDSHAQFQIIWLELLKILAPHQLAKNVKFLQIGNDNFPIAAMFFTG
jgi:hypothetical protein